MSIRQPLKHCRTLWCQSDSRLAPVFGPTLPCCQPVFLQPVDQSYRAVMSNEQVGSQRANRGRILGFQSPNCEHHLMLLRLEPLFPGRFLTEMEKLTDLETEVSKSAVIIPF